MGVVYLAQQESLNKRLVALKVLSSHAVASEVEIALLKREANAAAKLRHPNIVQVYTTGKDRGIHFIAMEYVEGVDLPAILGGQAEAPSGVVALRSAIGPVSGVCHHRGELANALDLTTSSP